MEGGRRDDKLYSTLWWNDVSLQLELGLRLRFDPSPPNAMQWDGRKKGRNGGGKGKLLVHSC